MDAKIRRRCVSDAYGQVVWSWSPDAGIKSVNEFHRRRRLTSPVLRREREVSRKAIAQGVPDVSAYLTILCALLPFSAHKACGCVERPAFPAPSHVSRDENDAKLGHVMPREC